MTKDELRHWIINRQLTRAKAAAALGLSVPALDHQLGGYSPVGRQTELIVKLLTGRPVLGLE